MRLKLFSYCLLIVAVGCIQAQPIKKTTKPASGLDEPDVETEVQEEVQKGFGETTESGGKKALFGTDQNESETMVATAENSIKGSKISTPPGTFSLPTIVTIEQSETLLNPENTEQTELDINSISEGGPSVEFSSNGKSEPVKPMTLAIPVSSNLALSDGSLHYAILYKVKKTQTGKMDVGLILSDKFKILEGFAEFQFNQFGIFQVIQSSEPFIKTNTTDSLVENDTQNDPAENEGPNLAPVANDTETLTMNEDSSLIITLPYSDPESDRADSCEVSELTNLSAITPCACIQGVCTVELKGDENYNGTASAQFSVMANASTSNLANIKIQIAAVDDLPETSQLELIQQIDEDSLFTIQLPYQDADGEMASSCDTKNLSNITVETACTCLSGQCSVVLQGTVEYSGPFSFEYSVTVEGVQSAYSQISGEIDLVNDTPEVSGFVATAFDEDTPTTIALPYNDPDSSATGCSVSNHPNLTVETPCTCSGGNCSVEVQGTKDFHGAFSFDFDVTAGGMTSNAATVTGTINSITDTVSIHPLYSNAPNWNDYYQNTGTDTLTANNTPCAGTEGYNECLHGGEKRYIDLTTYASCGDLYATDSLGVFHWVCKDNGGTAKFYSTGINDGKGLRNLLDANGWKSMHVTIWNGSLEIAKTASAPWALNTVVKLDSLAGTPFADGGDGVSGVDNTGTTSGSTLAGYNLSTAGTIYTIPANVSYPGLIIGANKVAVVVLEGATLTRAGTAANCNSNAGFGNAEYCLVTTNGKDFAWIEGDFKGVGTGATEYLVGFSTGSNFSVGRNIRTIDAASNGLKIANADHNRFTNIRVVNSNSYGVSMIYSDKNYLKDIYAFNNASHGVFFYRSHYNYVSRLFSANNGGRGFDVNNSGNNTLSFITAVSNVNYGVFFMGENANSSKENTLFQAASLNSQLDPGFALNTTYVERNVLAQLAAYGNQKEALFIHQDVGTTITHNFLFGGNYRASAVNGEGCNVTGSSNNVASAVDCGGDSGTLNVVEGLNLSATFLEAISDDGTNGNSNLISGGSLGFTSVTDWFGFDDHWRFWGLGANANFMDAANRGRCSSSDNCSIWSFKPQKVDTQIRNNSGDGENQNTTFTSGQACPVAVVGDKTLHDNRGAEIAGDSIGNDDGVCEFGEKCTNSSEFLVNAFEIDYDELGNNDGICNSNEACIYAPNFGAYQGNGDYKSAGTCTFQDGTGTFKVTGVMMYAYPNN